MNRPSTLSSRRRPIVCATSIAAFLAAGSYSPGDTFTVDLGDTLTVSTAVATDLTKFGLGTLRLDTAQTYAGATQIHAGTLVVDSTSFPINSAISVFGHTTQGTTAGQLAISGTYAPQTFTFGSQAFFAGGGPGGNGVALLNVGNNTLSGGMATSSTGVTRLGTGFGMATITSLAISGGVSTVQTTALQNGGNVASNWTISGLTGANGSLLQKQSNNTLILSGNNSSYLGAIDLNGGFVRVSAANNLGGTVAANAINFNNATLEVRTEGAGLDFGTGANSRGVSLASNNGTINLDRAVGGSGLAQTVTFGNLTLAGNRNLTVNSRNGYGVQFGTGLGGNNGQNTITNNGNGTVIFTGNVFGTADGTARILTLATANANSDITIQGNITATSTNAHSISKTGTGTLTILGTAGTYSGQTNIQNGTLTARTFRSIGNSSVAANILLGETANTGTLNMIGAAGSGAIPVLTGTAARNFTLNGTTGGGRINANQSGSAANALIIAGNVSNANATAKNLTLGGTSTLENEISGNIIDSTSTAGSGISLVKTNSGTWVLSGTGNTYTGTTTIQNGTLKLKSNASNVAVLPSTSAIIFNVDGDQNAGGTLELVGANDTANTQSLGSLTPTQGANTVRVTPGTGAATLNLTFASLGGTSSASPSINFVTPTASDDITITGLATGFVRGSTYFNGGDFAYSDAGVLRAPVYGTDASFFTTATGPLTPGSASSAAHNLVTGSFSQGLTTIGSLKISGSQTLTQTGQMFFTAGSTTSNGIIMTGGQGTIRGNNLTANSGARNLVIRVDGVTDELVIASTITNAIQGGVTKNGAGVLILGNSNNAYTGGTTINEGTLKLAGVQVLGGANGATVIRQGATLDVNGFTTGTRIGTFNGGGIVTNNGSVAGTLVVGNNNGTGTFSGVISNGSAAASLDVIKQGTGAQTWSGLNTYTGPTTINSTGIVSVPNLANIGSASGLGAGNASSNAASLVFGGSSATFATGGISYTGTASASIDRLFTFGATANAGSGARIQANGANNSTIVFNNAGSAAYALGAASTVAQTLTLGGASTGDNEIKLLLANSGSGGTATLGVQKADAGTWVLSGANTYTGTTTISGGRLIAVDGLGLPTNSALVLSGGVLESSGTFSRNLNTATIPAAGSGGVRWNSTQGTAIASGGFAASSDKLTVYLNTGAPNLTWATDGFMTNVGSAAASATMILNSTTALSEVEFRNNIELGTSTIARVIQVDDNTTTTTDFATLSGVLSGATTGTTGSGINKTGAGVLQLLGANTHAGLTTASAGTLVIRDWGTSTSASSNLGAGTAILRLNGALVSYVGAGESSDRTIHLNASTTLDGSGTGGLVITSTILNAGSAAKTLTLQGLKAGGNEITSVLSNAADVSTSALTITKGGGGTWVLSGANTYTGTTNVGSGNLGAGSDTAFGTGLLSVTNGNIFADGGDRTLANVVNLSQNATGGVIGVNSLTLSGTVNVGNGGNSNVNNFLDTGKQLEFTNTVTNADTGAARTLVMGGFGRSVFTGTIQDDPSTAVRALGFTLSSGTVVFQSSTGNNYSGNTTINGGTLQLAGGSGALIRDGATSGLVTFGNTVFPATLDLNGQSETINGLTGTSTGLKTIDNTSASASTLTFSSGSGSTVNNAINFNGNITQTGGGAVSLVHSGTAAGTLSGTTMSFTGGITVSSGTTGSLSFTGADPTGVTGITVAGGNGLNFLNGQGNPISALTLLSLGVGSGTTTLGLNLGPASNSLTWDTLSTSGAATTANGIAFDLVGLVGFGGAGTTTYDLLLATSGLDTATYSIASAPGGYTYNILVDPTFVRLQAVSLPGARVFWTNDQDNSWATLNAGPETNWADSAGVEYGSAPGPLDTVIFSSTLSTAALPVGPTYATVLDGNFPIDSIEFNGQTSSAGVAANVHIGAGNNPLNTLTIGPASSTAGISIPNASGTASIGSLVSLGADQTWTTGTATGNLGSVLTVSGVMSGTGNLTKSGLGSATITGNNTRTGKTAIDQGTLVINTEAALGVVGTAAVADQLSFNGGTLRFTAVTTIDDANRGVTINAGGATMDMRGSSGSFASNIVIAGSGGLTKIGGNNLGLLGANSYSGNTTIDGGLVVLGHAASLGTGTAVLDNSGVVLEVRDSVNSSNAITISNNNNEKTLRLQTGATTGEFSGAIAVNETSTQNFRVSAAAGGTLTISGAITSQTGTTASGIRKEGAGTVLLSNSGNALNGPSSIAAGVLRHGANAVLNSTTALTVHGVGGVAATLDLNSFNQTVGSVTFGGTAGAAASTNSVTTGAGTLALGGNVTVTSTGNFTTAPLISGNLSLNGARTFTVGDSTGSATDLLVSAVISNGSAASEIRKLGAGTMQLTGANTFLGVSSIGVGVLQHGANDVLGASASTVRIAANTATPATLDLNGFNQTITSLTFGGGGGVVTSANTLSIGGGTLTLAGNVTVNNNGNPTTGSLISATGAGNVTIASDRTFTVNNSTGAFNDLLISAPITGAGGIVKAGTGAMALSGVTNSYGGTTTINAGILRNAATDVIPGNVLVNATAANGTAAYDLDSFSELIGTLTLGGAAVANPVNAVSTGTAAGVLTLGGTVTTVAGSTTSQAHILGTGTVDLAGAVGFTVADATGVTNDLDVSAVLTGAGDISKGGAGTMRLSGANTNTGKTSVTAGRLSISSDGNLGTAPGSAVADQLTLNGGTLLTTANFSGDANRGITLGASGGTFETAAATTYTALADITGSGALTKTGAGILELGGATANTYTGLTTVTAGEVNLNKPAGTDAISSDVGAGGSDKTDDVLVNGGILRLLAADQIKDSVSISVTSGQLLFNNVNETIYNLNVSGSGFVNYGTGDVVIDDPTWGVGGVNEIHGNTTFGSLFIEGGAGGANGTNTVFGSAGPGGGPGRLRIGTVSTPGPIDFGNGLANGTPTLTLNSDNATPGRLQFTAGNAAGLTFTGTGTSTGLIQSAGADTNAGEVDLNASTRTFNIGDAASSTIDMTISAKIVNNSGTAGFDKTGTGTLMLSGDNTYNGTTTVSAGILNIQSANALGATGSGTTVVSGATLQLEDGVGITYASEALTLSGTGASGQTGALVNVDGTNVHGGAVTLAADATISVDAGSLTLSGGVSGGANDLTLNSATTLNVTGDISGTGGLNVTGGGSVLLNPTTTNSFSGATDISGAGTTLIAEGAGALGSTSGITVNTGGSLLLSGASVDDKINNGAGLTLSSTDLVIPGLNTAGLSETLGVLTLTQNSIIDFGAGASILSFADSSGASWGAFTLSLWNWSGTEVSGGGTDQIRFASNGLTAGQLSQIHFFTDAGITEVSFDLDTPLNGFRGSFGEVVPIPEPSGILVGLTMLGLAGWRERRKSNTRRREERAASRS